jgi:hypothetical protein
MDRATLLAEAYRRGQLPPKQAAAYEQAVSHGLIDDTYAAGRLKARAMGPSEGAAATLTRAIPGVSELFALAPTAYANAQDSYHNRFGPNDGWAAEWKKERDRQQGEVDEFKATHPVSSNMADGAGNFLPAMLTAGSAELPALFGTLRQSTAKTLPAAILRNAPAVLRNAMTGALVGGVYGASRPGTLAQRAANGNRAVLPGAAVGVVAPAVAGGAMRLASAGENAVNAARAALPKLPGEFAAALDPPLRNMAVNNQEGFDRFTGRTARNTRAIAALRELPDHLTAMPDNEMSWRFSRLKDQVKQLPLDDQYRFLRIAEDPMFGEMDQDPDWNGWTGNQLADMHESLADYSRTFRLKDQPGEVLADKLAEVNDHLINNAKRSQPAFAQAIDGKSGGDGLLLGRGAGANQSGANAQMFQIRQYRPMSEESEKYWYGARPKASPDVPMTANDNDRRVTDGSGDPTPVENAFRMKIPPDYFTFGQPPPIEPPVSIPANLGRMAWPSVSAGVPSSQRLDQDNRN